MRDLRPCGPSVKPVGKNLPAGARCGESLDYFFRLVFLSCLFAIAVCFFFSKEFNLDCFWFLSFCFDLGDLSPMIFG
jgi:hypothetical protein